MFSNTNNKLETFRKTCEALSQEPSYKNKVNILKKILSNGSKTFEGDLLLWINMLLPKASRRVYNLQNKQMLKLFAKLFACDHNEMVQHLEMSGDISETLSIFFNKSNILKPQNQSTIHLQEVDDCLQKLEKCTKEEAQAKVLQEICQKCTTLDLKIVIRLIKQDLRINAGACHILEALGTDAYSAYQSSRDLDAVVMQFVGNTIKSSIPAKETSDRNNSGKLGQIKIMTPISPMLANACKSVDEAFRKNPNGLFAEVKYDGERVQIHKRNTEFKYFTRNMKPVMNHKVEGFKQCIPACFPCGGDMILDSEIVLVDKVSHDLLPFGSLGSKKKNEFSNSEICIFIFDCLLYKGKDLTNLSLLERRKILEENLKPVSSTVRLSESYFIETKHELALMTAKIFKANLEGIVLKSPNGSYQPGKRGWLKIKKDYLFEGKMADSADLVVLGGWFGSGKKGGILSIFLMGCYDTKTSVWKTVTKVHSGLDDESNVKIHKQLFVLMERTNRNKIPSWLLCNKSHLPDFLARDPLKMPVWEITGAEFSKSEAHTASGISIRFPRVTRLRDDKAAKDATDLEYLVQLYESSKKNVNVDLFFSKYEGIGNSSSTLEASSTLNHSLLSSEVARSFKNYNSSLIEEKIPLDGTLCNKNVDNKTITLYNEKCFIGKHEMDLDLMPYSMKDKHVVSLGTCQSDVKNLKQIKSGIFKDFIAFFDFDKKSMQFQTIFTINGGTITYSSKEANIAFYGSTKICIDIKDIRNKFKRSCRHLFVEWVNKSVEDKKLALFCLYAVML